jgi:hypothetical protein
MNYENTPAPDRRGFDVCSGAAGTNRQPHQTEADGYKTMLVTGGISGSGMPGSETGTCNKIEESELAKVVSYAQLVSADLERLDLIADRVFGAEPSGREWVTPASGGMLDQVKALVMNLERHAAAVRTRFEFPHLG